MTAALVVRMDKLDKYSSVDEDFHPPCAVQSDEATQCRQAIEDIVLKRCRPLYASCRVVSVNVTVPLDGCKEVHSCTYDVTLDLGENWNLGRDGASALGILEVMFSNGVQDCCAGAAGKPNLLRGLELQDCKLCFSSRAGDLWVIELQFALMAQLHG